MSSVEQRTTEIHSDELPADGPAIGQWVEDRYFVKRFVGERGLSYVYEALDAELEQPVTLKLLAPAWVGRPEREQRFYNEALLRDRVDSPALPRILRSGRVGSEGQPLLVLEPVAGAPLRAWLETKPHHEPKMRVALQIAEAIAAMHRNRIVHREITPDTILVARDLSVALLDLSSAAESAEFDGPPTNVRRLTQPNETPGAYGYMSPEQARGAAAAPSMDVYAFGLSLFEMFQGRAAFGHRSAATFTALQSEGKLELPTWTPTPEVPPAIQALIARCCATDPSDRPSIEEAVEELRRAVEGSVPAPTPFMASAPADDPPATTEGDAETESEPQAAEETLPQGVVPELEPETTERDRRRKRLALAFVGASLAIAFVVAVQEAVRAPDRAVIVSAVPTPEPLPLAMSTRPTEPAEPEPPARTVAEPEPTPEPMGPEPPPKVLPPTPTEIEAAKALERMSPKLVTNTPAVAMSPANESPATPSQPEPRRTSAADHMEAGAAPAASGQTAPASGRAVPARSSGGGKVPRSANASGDASSPSGSSKAAAALVDPFGACEGVRDRAKRAASERQWEDVLAATDDAQCWTANRTGRQRLRVRAYAELGQWKPCLQAAAKSNDSKVQQWASVCSRFR